MYERKASITFFLDGSRPSSEGKCLIKLNVYYNSQKKRYPTEYHATRDEWTKINGGNLRDENLKKIKTKLNQLKTRAEKIAENITPFSFVAFEENHFGGSIDVKSRNLEDWFNITIARLDSNDQVGTSGSYKTTRNSINHFRRGLQIHDVTEMFLRSYEKHLLEDKKSSSTVGIYMRNLRAIMNEAIEAKVLSREKYPFSNYQIPTGQNVKKALKDFDINLILNYKPLRSDQQLAIDLWIFSYLCNGMNFADIVALKQENINGRLLTFYRQKTLRTKKKDLRPIKVGLNSRALTIIQKHGNNDPSNPYLFGVLRVGLTAKQIKGRCNRLIKWVNKRMYEICTELKIEHKTSTYAARHTFSTVMKRNGVPTSYIKDALGHSTELMTESYLDSFADDIILEYADLLTKFK